MAGSLPTSKVRCSTPDNAEEPYRRVFRKWRSSARLWEQLREYFEVRFRAEKYGVPYFLAESEAKQGDPRKETVRARAPKDFGGRGFKWRAPTRSVGRRPFKP